MPTPENGQTHSNNIIYRIYQKIKEGEIIGKGGAGGVGGDKYPLQTMQGRVKVEIFDAIIFQVCFSVEIVDEKTVETGAITFRNVASFFN